MTQGYSELLQRIQSEILVKDLTKERVEEFIHATPKFPERQKLAKEFLIAYQFTVAQKFAEERNIKLTEKTTAKIEKWKGKDTIVIRQNGKFRSWKRI